MRQVDDSINLIAVHEFMWLQKQLAKAWQQSKEDAHMVPIRLAATYICPGPRSAPRAWEHVPSCLMIYAYSYAYDPYGIPAPSHVHSWRAAL